MRFYFTLKRSRVPLFDGFIGDGGLYLLGELKRI